MPGIFSQNPSSSVLKDIGSVRPESGGLFRKASESVSPRQVKQAVAHISQLVASGNVDGAKKLLNDFQDKINGWKISDQKQRAQELLDAVRLKTGVVDAPVDTEGQSTSTSGTGRRDSGPYVTVLGKDGSQLSATKVFNRPGLEEWSTLSDPTQRSILTIMNAKSVGSEQLQALRQGLKDGEMLPGRVSPDKAIRLVYFKLEGQVHRGFFDSKTGEIAYEGKGSHAGEALTLSTDVVSTLTVRKPEPVKTDSVLEQFEFNLSEIATQKTARQPKDQSEISAKDYLEDRGTEYEYIVSDRKPNTNLRTLTMKLPGGDVKEFNLRLLSNASDTAPTIEIQLDDGRFVSPKAFLDHIQSSQA